MTPQARGPTAPGPAGRRTLAAALAALAVLAGAPGAAGRERPAAPAVPAEAALTIDARSGAVIVADDANERRPIASATKLMTALLTLERADPEQVLPASDYDPAPIESQIRLREGEEMAVRDLLVALLLESANDAAMTLAEGLEGSRKAFVAAMNERADRLGLDDTEFGNPIGFDDPRNYSTASDLATLARRLMRDRGFRRIVREPRLRLRTGDRRRVVQNRNELLGEAPGIDGIKTGHTQGAGYVLVGSAAASGERVISVVLGAPSEAARDAATRELLAYGLDQFRERRVVRSGDPVTHAAVVGHDGERIPLKAAADVSGTVLRGEPVETRVEAPAELEGPLAAEEEVGSVAALHRGEVLGPVPLVTDRPVPAPGTLTRVTTTLRDHLIAVVVLAVALAGGIALALARARRHRAGGEGRAAR